MSSLPIPELVESMASLFYLGEFDDVKNILTDRENMIRTQVESLGRDALERMQGMAELERSKFEERLRDSQRECEVLKEEIARLTADRVSNDGERRGQEGLDGVCEDHTKMLEARNEIIFELNGKLSLLENQILEKDQVVRECEDKLKGLDGRVVQLDAEVETLKQQKMEADEIVEQLECELSEFEGREEKLREKNMEACELLEQLRQQMLAAEAHTMRSDEAIRKLKRKELEADRTVQKLRREILAGEEHKKMSDQMLDKMRAKESEDVRRMQELRKQNLEASRTVEELRQQVLAAEENKKMCDQAVEEIRARQLEDIRTVEELKRKSLETSYTMEELRQHILATEERIKISDKTIEEMKARQSEDIRTVEELRRQKLEAYNAAEIHKRRFENLAPMAEGLASLLKVKVDDLVNLVTVKDKSPAAEGNEGLIFRVSKNGKGSLRNDSADSAGNADVLVIVKSLGDRNVPESSWMKHGDIVVYNAHQTSSPVQPEYATPQAERNYGNQESGSRKLLDSGRHAGSGLELSMSVSEQLMIQPWRSHQLTPYRADAGVIIDIIDSDEETTEPVYISTPPNQTNKQKDSSSEVFLIPQKRKRTEFEIDWQKGDVNIVGETSNSQILKYDDFNDGTPTQNLDNQALQRTWMFASDMLKAFMEDDELCMNAVCALYRQQVSASKTPGGFAGLFHHFESMGGCALAEYLICGDPELKLRSSVVEVREKFNCAIHLCRRLATDYYENLFALYCNGDDPFFRSG